MNSSAEKYSTSHVSEATQVQEEETSKKTLEQKNKSSEANSSNNILQILKPKMTIKKKKNLGGGEVFSKIVYFDSNTEDEWINFHHA